MRNLNFNPSLLVINLLPLYAFLHQFLIRFYGFTSWYGDWFIHYQVSQFYLRKYPFSFHFEGGYTFTSRPPLFNLNASYFLNILGEKFAVFQIFSSVANALFVFSFYLLLKDIFKPGRFLPFLLSLLFLHPTIYRHLTYTWNKLFTTYLIFGGLVFGLRAFEKKEYLWFSGIAWGLAALSHQFSYFYFLCIFLYTS